MVGRVSGEQLNGVDDFDDGVRDISAWGDADTVVGDANLSEIDGHVQFISSSGSGTTDTVVRSWQMNRGATTNDWQAEVLVFLPYYLSLFADGQKVSMGLRVAVAGDPGRSADLNVSAMMSSGVVTRSVDGAVQSNGNPVNGQEVSIARADSGGWIRFRFEASSKSLLMEYASVDQPGKWTGVSTAMLDSSEINWQLTDQDKFEVSLVASSNSYSVRSSDQVWFDTFLVASKPVILEQPNDAFVEYCETATMTVSADAGPLATYQWRHEGTNLVGEVSSELIVSEFAANRYGDYDVVVSNPAGNTISETATLGLIVSDPTLGYAIDSSGIHIYWPAGDCSASAFTLQKRVSLKSGAWEDVPPPYVENNGSFDITFPIAGESMFFRFIKRN